MTQDKTTTKYKSVAYFSRQYFKIISGHKVHVPNPILASPTSPLVHFTTLAKDVYVLLIDVRLQFAYIWQNVT